jgi:hypothetical protein
VRPDVRNVVVWYDATAGWMLTWDELILGAGFVRHELPIPADLARRAAEDSDAALLVIAGARAMRHGAA